MDEFDVIVVGGGPAGSATAAFCAQRGRRVALLEHKTFPRHKVCGDVLNPNAWPVLERLGVADKVRQLPHHRIAGAGFSTCRGAMVDVPDRNERDLRAIRRRLLDDCLLHHARDCGVVVCEGAAVHEVRPQWRVLTREQELTGRILVGADGRHSPVATKTGLTCGAVGNGHFAFQSHYQAPRTLDDRVQLHLFPRGYCGLVRVDDDRVNVCLVTDRDGARHHGNPEQLFAETALRNPRFRALGIEPVPLDSMQSAHPLCRQMNVPAATGVFLVGDALRTMEPFTGQGVYFALRSAELAAVAICERDEPERDYHAAVRRLYRRRGVTNELLRRLMYHETAARPVMRMLGEFPLAVRWLADNVLGGGRGFE